MTSTLAVDWADEQARDGCEVFVGMNPRTHEGRDKSAVEQLAACYIVWAADVDAERTAMIHPRSGTLGELPG